MQLTWFETKSTLTHKAVMDMLSAGIAKAEQLRQPQCIVIVDASGELLGEIRMTGAKFLSRGSARTKARTAASIGVASTNIPAAVGPAIAAATGGSVTGLPGGLPVLRDGVILGGVGVGSGSGEEDIAVAVAALAAIGLEDTSRP